MGESDSAFDLHLGTKCFEMIGTTKLKADEAVESVLTSSYSVAQLNLSRPQVLSPNVTYLIELCEMLDFKGASELHARATGKSSAGRLDVLTHLIVNGESQYDCVPSGYRGNLYLQVTPLTFPVRVKRGDRLNQLRIFCGEPGLSEVAAGAREFEDGLLMSSRGSPADVAVKGGFLSLSIASEKVGGLRASAFVAKKRQYDAKDALSLAAANLTYNPENYWERIPDSEHIEAEPYRMYIVRSRERLRLPKDIAVECIAMTENLGDVRIHYAGFAHPLFGLRRSDGKAGTPLMFEVRCFTKQVLRQEERFAAIKFYRMSEAVDDNGKPSFYDRQELQLSKIFKAWPKKSGRSQASSKKLEQQP
jgi:dCTP deaminase